jgi:hypothetical protein
VQGSIAKIVAHPWLVGILALAFSISMLAFWIRIRRDDRRRPDPESGSKDPAAGES